MKKRTFNPETIKAKYSQIPILDIHYYGLKGYGISDYNIREGHPKFHLISDKSLFSVTTLISSTDSPYTLTDKLRFEGKELPFRVKNIGRVHRTLGYFYYRGIQEWIPTLDSDTILSTNFHPNCKGCFFCSRVECSSLEESLKNINGEEGIKYCIKKGVDLSKVDKITVVTGMFRNEDGIINHLKEIKTTAFNYGFNGRLLYIGSQIKTVYGVKRILEIMENIPFKYAYTLETFTKRDTMHKLKRESLEEALNVIQLIKENGIEDLEYTYIPGIDPLEIFSKFAPKFVRYAKPHLSIFRPAVKKQNLLRDLEFIQNPVTYLCQMRLYYENLYGGPIYANNLANLWPFPIDRINPLFLTDKTKFED